MKILKEEYNNDIHISLGMTIEEERSQIIDFWRSQSKRVVLYHCTSCYPCPFDKLYLKEIEHLHSISKPLGFRIGFSNHGYGISADIASMVLGAEWIERHFIDDRTFRHTDAAASLEPDGFRKLCRDIKNVFKALNYKPNILDQLEIEQKNKLRISN
jgi:N-acetylneuraminate synthase